MNTKIVALGAGGLFTATAATLGYFLSNSHNQTINPLGKTGKAKYPTLKVPSYDGRSLNYDNNFWLEKARKLESWYQKDIRSALDKSIRRVVPTAHNLYWREDGKRFLVGHSEVAQILVAYCVSHWDKEEPSIKNFADVMKDLCT